MVARLRCRGAYIPVGDCGFCRCPDAHVSDDGHDFRGREEIRDWLSGASAEFTYTRTLVDATATAPNTWLVVNHLEGNFPGGVVDLRYRFVVADGLISELEIAP